MAADAFILRTYGDVNIRESVLGLIEILTAEDDSIQKAIRKTKAIAGVHATLLDTLKRLF